MTVIREKLLDLTVSVFERFADAHLRVELLRQKKGIYLLGFVQPHGVARTARDRTVRAHV